MRIVRITAFVLIGVLLILGACASPAPTTPAPALETLALAPTTPTPAPAPAIPAPATPAPVLATPAPAPATPAPASTPEQAGDTGYIIDVIPTSAQAGFLISQLQVDREEVLVGDYVTFSVGVTNTGGQRGTYTVVLKFNDAIIKTQDVTIDGGRSSTVELSIVPEKCNWYKVTAGQLTARLGVFY